MRNPKKIIHSSSPDRGLQHLLEIFPDVRKAVPDVELEWFYGWELFDRFYANNPSSMAWKKKMLAMLSQDGVVKHGRLSQIELEAEMKTCGIWAYPAHFREINCISAIKAQALGCVPIVINEAALQTTVQFGIKVNGDIYDDEVKEVYKQQLIWLLQHPEWQEEVRTPMMEWGKTITWARVAEQWKNMFEGNLTEAIISTPSDAIVKFIDGYASN